MVNDDLIMLICLGSFSSYTDLMLSRLYDLVVSVNNDRLACWLGMEYFLLIVHLGWAAGWGSDIYTARLTIKGFHFKLSY